MAIPSRQIGWGTEENLLWQISKQLENLTKVVYNIPNNTTSTTSTTSTTTTASPVPNMSLTVTNNSGNFDIIGGNNFTIEWFAYYANTSNHPRAYSFGSYFTGGASHAVSIENGTFYWWVNGNIIINAPVNIENGWHHMCVMRVSDVTQVYIDGVSVGSALFSGDINTNSKPLYIGSEGDDSLSNALFSNFRFNTNDAYYTAGGFTPPSAPLTSSGSNLLLFQGDSLPLELVDNSGAGNIINNGTGVYNGDNPFNGYEGSILFGTVPVTVTAGISSVQSIACAGGMSITVGLSGTTICDSNTVYNTNGDFVGFTDIWLGVNGQSRLYTNVDDVSAVSSTSCVSCPGLTAAITSIDACTGAVGSVFLVPTYAGPPLLCDCTSFTASDAIILSAGTYFVSNGTFARPFSYPGSGTTLTAVGTCSPC